MLGLDVVSLVVFNSVFEGVESWFVVLFFVFVRRSGMVSWSWGMVVNWSCSYFVGWSRVVSRSSMMVRWSMLIFIVFRGFMVGNGRIRRAMMMIVLSAGDSDNSQN